MPSLLETLWSVVQPQEAAAKVLADTPGHRTMESIEGYRPGDFLMDDFTRLLYQSVLHKAQAHPQTVSVETGQPDVPGVAAFYSPKQQAIALTKSLDAHEASGPLQEAVGTMTRQQPLIHELLHFLMRTHPSGATQHLSDAKQHAIITYLLGSPYANDPDAAKPFAPENYPRDPQAHAQIQRLLAQTPLQYGVWQNPGDTTARIGTTSRPGVVVPSLNPEDHP